MLQETLNDLETGGGRVMYKMPDRSKLRFKYRQQECTGHTSSYLGDGSFDEKTDDFAFDWSALQFLSSLNWLAQ